jgi:3-carboxy-cis,cis-muconate cycloisomerase
MGVHADEIRRDMAKRLDLIDEIVPWHVSRDRFLDVSSQCANLCVTLVRIAREIIDLSRNEIDEVFEPGGHHKGASSTMPQKRNPVMSEAVIGLGLQAIGQGQMMFRAGEVSHERAAGEWQLEWKALPEVFISSITATRIASEMIAGLGVNEEKMLENLNIHNGSIMSEAYMIELSHKLGREKAHNIVHEASKISLNEGISLSDSLLRMYPEFKTLVSKWPLSATDYVGNSKTICMEAIDQWNQDLIKT